MGFKDFLVKKSFERQLKKLPESQKELFKKIFDNNPKFFEELAVEIRSLKKKGLSEEMAGAMAMKKHQNKMVELMQKAK